MNDETYDEGGPAFPAKLTGPCEAFGLRADSNHAIEFHGMTLRDYFAAKAMPVAFKKWENYYHSEENLDDDKTDRFLAEGIYIELIANTAYEMADAMLISRKQ
jgi:hypothetical protein